MKKYYCNPLNLNYRYQFTMEPGEKRVRLGREAADPSLIRFKGVYYLFPSMSKGFWYSDDLAAWEFHPIDERALPVYDYAPDVRVVGDYIYFCASHRETPCDFYRTDDLFSGKFEKFEGTFDFWDPNLFLDDDGRLYFYWGCSNYMPIQGVEMDPETMRRIGDPVPLFTGDPANGFERMGEDHVAEDNGVFTMMCKNYSEQTGVPAEKITQEMLIAALPEHYKAQVKATLANSAYVEGAWMTKYGGKYYLQYAVPDTRFNVYGDGVYESDHPLGPFCKGRNNPFSYRPAGFATGAGHGSTCLCANGRGWHASTIAISRTHPFERRVGLWKCGVDRDGELLCNQRFADWVTEIGEKDIWKEPKWMLLSYGKKAAASSESHPAAHATDENIRTWWRAATNKPGEWLEVDLGGIYDVRAVQVNFTDEIENASLPAGREWHTVNHGNRYIDDDVHFTRWLLEGSKDGRTYFIIEDKRQAQTDLPHDLVVREKGFAARYLRLTVQEVPYGQNACVSGLRVFGKGKGKAPAAARLTSLVRTSDFDFSAQWQGDALGYNVLWGHAPDKLYHCKQVLGACDATVGALVKGEEYYVRIDSFNESGITHGKIKKLQS